MAMKHRKIKFIPAVTLAVLILASAVMFTWQQKMVLTVEEQETGKVYATLPVKAGDELSFQWEHSFEHIPWYE